MKQSIRNPSQAERTVADIEARLVVLEIVSMTSLALALDASDSSNAEQARNIMTLMMETVRQRCREMGLSDSLTGEAERYAAQLLATALQSLYPDSD